MWGHGTSWKIQSVQAYGTWINYLNSRLVKTWLLNHLLLSKFLLETQNPLWIFLTGTNQDANSSIPWKYQRKIFLIDSDSAVQEIKKVSFDVEWKSIFSFGLDFKIHKILQLSNFWKVPCHISWEMEENSSEQLGYNKSIYTLIEYYLYIKFRILISK